MLYIDDRLSRHPKILKAGEALGGQAVNGSALALALFLDALSYTKAHLTNGFIPASFVSSSLLVADPKAVADALTRARLWHRVAGGFRFHDFLDWNKSAADVKRDREKWRAKKRRQRKSSNGEFSEQSPRDMPGDSRRDSRARASMIHVPRTTVQIPAGSVQTEATPRRVWKTGKRKTTIGTSPAVLLAIVYSTAEGDRSFAEWGARVKDALAAQGFDYPRPHVLTAALERARHALDRRSA